MMHHNLCGTRVIAVTGGKGGVGKTNVAVNLSVALAGYQQQILLIDADIGLANIDILLGLRAERTMIEVMEGKACLEDVLLTGPKGIKVIPSSSGIHTMNQIHFKDVSEFIHLFSGLEQRPKNILIDTAAGINDSVIGFCGAADEVILVVCNEPPALADAYALMKFMNYKHHLKKFRIIVNKVGQIDETMDVFAKLTKVVDKFLGVSINLLGGVPKDRYLEKSVMKCKAVVELYPNSKSAIAFKDMARKIMNWSVPKHLSGNMQFFRDKKCYLD